MQRLGGPCIGDKACTFTIGYYVGGGQWVCFLHALANGWDVELERAEKDHAKAKAKAKARTATNANTD